MKIKILLGFVLEGLHIIYFIQFVIHFILHGMQEMILVFMKAKMYLDGGYLYLC